MNYLYRATIFFFLSLFNLVEGGECPAPLAAPYVYHSVNVITGCYVESATDLTLEGSHPLAIRRSYESESVSHSSAPPGWLTNQPAFLGTSKEAGFFYSSPASEYDYDSEERLIEAHNVQSEDSGITRSFKVSYSQKGEELSCLVVSDDQTSLRYRYFIDRSCHGQPAVYLKKIEKNGVFLVSYDYQKHPFTRGLLLKERKEPDDRFLLIEYYDQRINDVGGTEVTLDDAASDNRWGRVKLLKSPVGPGSEPVITHRFFYGDGQTEVRDALDHKIIYRYGEFDRLTAIEYYDEEERLYRTELFNWHQESSQTLPLMKSRTVKEADGSLVAKRTFEYDEQGHVIKETLCGDLRGYGDFNEKSWTTYKYDGKKVIEKTEGDHLKVSYRYNRSQQLIAEHEEIDSLLHKRTLYEHDLNGFVVTTIVDNGSSLNRHDLAGVTQRHLTRTTYSLDPTSFGQPLTINELYWDLETNSEVLIGRVVNHYSDTGLLIRQQAFDGTDFCVKDVQYDYDKYKRLVMEAENSAAVTIYEYDRSGNQSLQVTQLPDGSSLSITKSYDYSNRLLRIEEVDSQGHRTVVVNHYNAAGLKIAEVKGDGSTTSYSYDALGRLISKQDPAVLDQTGAVQYPKTKYDYDTQDRIIALTDPNGWTTKIRYNARGKPTEKKYPDGSKETFRYNLAGMLKKETTRTGLRTSYTRDGWNRPLTTLVKDSKKNEISSTSSTYDTFHLLSQSDTAGANNTFLYDSAGRLIVLQEDSLAGSQRTEYTYDEKGRIASTKKFHPHGWTEECPEYDEFERLVGVSKTDQTGALLQRDCFPEEKDKSLHKKSGYELNTLGQEVQFTEETDHLGCVIHTQFDIFGRPAKTIKKTQFDVSITSTEYRYDAAGNKTLEVYSNNEECPSFILCWEYGVGNRLEAMIEGVGAVNQRTTRYDYNSVGLLASVTKPDGIVLRYRYSNAGIIQELSSSDETVHYQFDYDDRGNVAGVKDFVLGAETTRRYTNSDQVMEETLANGLKMRFKYNQAGQRIKTTFPDASSAAYTYDGLRLKSIHRFAPSPNNQNVLYTHTYQSDINGKILASSLIGNAGVVRYAYNDSGKVKAIKSPYRHEKIKYDAFGQSVSSIVHDVDDPVHSDYTYNDAGELIAENGMISRQYSYDFLENRRDGDVDSMSQLYSLCGTTYTYDANGNLAGQCFKGEATTYSYDALNRLTSVVKPGRSLICFTYDAFSRRLSKEVSLWDAVHSTWKPQDVEKYFYDGLREIGATDASNGIRQLRILGNGVGAEIGAAVAVELEGVAYAPLHDARNNIVGLVDLENKELAESYRYTAFGSQLIYDRDGNAIDQSTLGMSWGYASKRQDPETGWIFFGQRYYDPTVGRWTTPDPLGYLDGPNRYAYVHNNPLGNYDLYGEFTVGEAWDSCVKALTWGISSVQDSIRWFQQKIGFAHNYREKIEKYTHLIAGSAFLRLVGFYADSAETGVLGNGEVSDKVRITLINGILNIRYEYIESVTRFSEAHGGMNIHYVFRPSDGWAYDLLKGAFSKAGLVSSQSRLLARTWKQLIHEMDGVNGGGTIVHYAHSIGGTETFNAKKLMTPQERKMIKIITLGSATLIPNEGFQSVINYTSWRDGVSCFDTINYFKALFNQNDNVKFIGSRWGIPLVDHFLENASYDALISFLGEDFMRSYGTL